MDEILIRFPTVGGNIFKNLDDESLVKCKEVNTIWCNFLDNVLLWRRRIQQFFKYQLANHSKFDKFPFLSPAFLYSVWQQGGQRNFENQFKFAKRFNLATTKVPLNILKKLVMTIEAFFKKYPKLLKKPNTVQEIHVEIIKYLELQKNPAQSKSSSINISQQDFLRWKCKSCQTKFGNFHSFAFRFKLIHPDEGSDESSSST